MRYEAMRPGQEAEVSEFVWKVFEEFEAPGYRQEGIEEFKRFIAPGFLAARSKTSTFFVICCWLDHHLAGVIAVRDNNHICLLFVGKQDQRKGIARELIRRAIDRCCRMNSELQTIGVNSSRYAVEIYEKMGFQRKGTEQERNGIRFTPMELRLD